MLPEGPTANSPYHRKCGAGVRINRRARSCNLFDNRNQVVNNHCFAIEKTRNTNDRYFAFDFTYINEQMAKIWKNMKFIRARICVIYSVGEATLVDKPRIFPCCAVKIILYYYYTIIPNVSSLLLADVEKPHTHEIEEQSILITSVKSKTAEKQNAHFDVRHIAHINVDPYATRIRNGKMKKVYEIAFLPHVFIVNERRTRQVCTTNTEPTKLVDNCK